LGSILSEAAADFEDQIRFVRLACQLEPIPRFHFTVQGVVREITTAGVCNEHFFEET
jgi:hypothetical protein